MFKTLLITLALVPASLVAVLSRYSLTLAQFNSAQPKTDKDDRLLLVAVDLNTADVILI